MPNSVEVPPVRVSIEVLKAYTECSDGVRLIVNDMMEIASSEDATKEEKDLACCTIHEALYPGAAYDIHSEFKKTIPEIEEGLDQEERTFAENLRAAMDEKGFTQTELAESTGVSQASISLMLSRECRPQQRTVKKLAEALSLQPEQLWPTVKQ